MTRAFHFCFNSEKSMTASEIAAELRAQADALDGSVQADAPEAAPAPAADAPRKRGRPAKNAAPEAAAPAAEESDPFSASEADAANSDFGDDFGAEPAPAAEPPKPAEPTLDEIITAFKAYAGKHGKEKAKAMLAKTGAKSVREIKPSMFVKLLAALNK